MTRQTKLILSGFLLFLVGLLMHLVYTCQSTIEQKMKQVDHDLLSGAMAAASIVPDTFNVHVQSGTIGEDEYLEVLKRLSSYVDTAGLDYIYTMTNADGAVRYTSTSATQQELQDGVVKYFDTYDDASSDLLHALNAGQITFETFTDSHGTYRSVFIPATASDGTRYIAGADIDISDLESIRTHSYLRSIVSSVYILLLLVPLAFILYKGAKVQEQHLNDEIARNTDDIRVLNKDLEERMAEVDRAAEASEQAMHDALEAKEEAEARREKVLDAASDLEGIVRRVTDAADSLSANVQTAVTGARVQLERSAETAAAMEEMNATVLEITRNANSAAGNADDARIGAENGAGVVGSVGEAINDVDRQSVQMKASLNELGEKAEGIGHIMNVISDIADQTNLLALNAAIEAARAGDAGRGFAVVADEVRKLAEKTMNATHEVGQVVTAIQHASQANIRGMEHTTESVGKSTELATVAENSLKEIVHIIEVTADQVRNIATASEQQSAASEQISRSAEEVKCIAEEAEERMTSSAKSVNELTQMSNELQTLIGKLLQA